MNTSKAMAFFKAGAWILVLAGFAHAVVAIFDAFLAGAFSPASDSAIQALKDTSINIADWLKGSSTSVLESAWSAYIGFAIAVGLLTGFIGLILLLAIKRYNVLDSRNRALLIAALWMSAAMTVTGILFYFWFPTAILAAGLVCFVLAWFKQKEKDMLLDKYLPEYDFTEVYSIKIKAKPEVAYRALQETTLGEIHWFVNFLFNLRALPEKLAGRKENPYTPPVSTMNKPMLKQMLESNFVKIDEQAPREIVFGLIVPGNIGRVWQKTSGYLPEIPRAAEFLAFNDPAFLHVIGNFTVADAPEPSYIIVRTESRTKGCSDKARKSFRPYWFIIRPWSGLIRRLWLQAIKKRAEGT